MQTIACPYWCRETFLGDVLAAELLAHACGADRRFVTSRIGSAETARHDPGHRISQVTREIGPLAALFRGRIRSSVPAALDAIGMRDFAVGEIELELAAHGDGAFFAPHVDTQLASSHSDRGPRVLSAVYYFHALPQRFSGGALRLHPFHPEPGNDDPVDIEPVHDRLVVFPSSARHEVRLVSCPGIAFADWRFALNCWVRKASDDPGAVPEPEA